LSILFLLICCSLISLQYLQMKWPMLDVPGAAGLKDSRSPTPGHLVSPLSSVLPLPCITTHTHTHTHTHTELHTHTHTHTHTHSHTNTHTHRSERHTLGLVTASWLVSVGALGHVEHYGTLTC